MASLAIPGSDRTEPTWVTTHGSQSDQAHHSVHTLLVVDGQFDSLQEQWRQTVATVTSDRVARLVRLTRVSWPMGHVDRRLAELREWEVDFQTLFVPPMQQAAPEASRRRDGIRAADAFDDLADWLQVPRGELARLLGVGRTTPNAWKRDQREPQAPTRGRLLRLHAALVGARAACGEAAVATWLRSGANPPIQLLETDWDQLAGLLADLVFSGERGTVDEIGSGVSETPVVAAQPATVKDLRRRRRRQ